MAMLRASTALILLVFLLAACGGAESTVTSPATTSSGDQASSPALTRATTVIASPDPSGSPTVVPGAGLLEIDQQAVLDVEVTDPATNASYATTEDSLYRLDEQGTPEQIGQWETSRSLLVDPTDHNVLYRGGHPGCAIGGPAVPFEKSTDGGRTWQALIAGQNVRPAMVDPKNPQVIYGERCVLTISADGGQTWTDYPQTPSFDVSAMTLVGTNLYLVITSEGGTSRVRPVNVADPSRPEAGHDLLEFWGGGTIAASADRIVVGEPHGIDISTDGGQHWTFRRAGLESVTVSVNALVDPIPNDELARRFGIFALAVDPANAGRIFAGSIRGLYLSQDNGQSWARVPESDEVPIHELAFAQNGALLYVTTGDGVVALPLP